MADHLAYARNQFRMLHALRGNSQGGAILNAITKQSSAFTRTAQSMAATLSNVGRQHTKPIAEMHKRLEKRDTDTLKVTVLGGFTSPVGYQHIVLENGKIYHLNRFLLNHLRDSGESCESLELIPVEEDNDHD